jgi:cyclopropane fatty-acyl-phospholipid synthase-like methyltransferase
VRDYYEELWERLPEHLEPPHLQLRAAFARANVCPGDRVLDLGCGDGALTGVLADAAGGGGAPR